MAAEFVEAVLRHAEVLHLGSRVVYSLSPKGLLREDFASGVNTHKDFIYYDEIWESCRLRNYPGRMITALAAGSLLAAAAPLVPNVKWFFLLPIWIVFGILWLLTAVSVRTVAVALYNYEGKELATLHGDNGPRFKAFTEKLAESTREARYPFQRVLEELRLGRCTVKGKLKTWSSTLLYDRVIFEEKYRWGFHRKEFYGLDSLQAPVRLSWKVPRTALTLAVAASLGAAPAFSLASSPGAVSAAWAMAVIGALCWIGSLAWLGVAVAVAAQDGIVESTTIPWWRVKSRRVVLKWFAAIVELADHVDTLRSEDYWEYHRAKLQMLREADFLDEWSYRSALARLKSRERTEMGE